MATHALRSLTLLVVVAAIASCGGGGGGSSAGGAPVGPVSYERIQQVFSEPPATAAQAVKSSSPNGLKSSSNCGSVMTDVGTGLTVASGFLSLIPEAGPVLGAVTNGVGGVLSLFGASAGNSCIENQINNINQQLATQQTEINAIQANLNLLQNEFYVQNYNNAVAIAGIEQQTLDTSLDQISGTNGQFNAFMQDAGLWQFSNQPIAGASLQDVTQAEMNSAQSSSTQTAFRNAIQNISSATYSPSSCQSGNCYQVVSTFDYGSNCAGSTGVACPALVEAFNALANAEAVLVQNTLIGGDNVVATYDNYNNTVVSLYQQSLYALQQAYMIEYSTNQMNYFFATNQDSASVTQIPSWGGVEGTYYSASTSPYDASTEATNYNNAQEQLTSMYAARVNALYITTLNYLITDAPISPQSWPAGDAQLVVAGTTYTDPNPVSYAQEASASVTGGIPLSIVGNNGYWVQAGQAALYQYSGIQDVNACISAVDSFNATQGNSGLISSALGNGQCPSIFVDTNGARNQGSYDGNTLVAYVNTSGTEPENVVLTGVSANNVGMCPNASGVIVTATAGQAGNAAGLVENVPYIFCSSLAMPASDVSDFNQTGGWAINIGGPYGNVTKVEIGSEYEVCTSDGCGFVMLGWGPYYNQGYSAFNTSEVVGGPGLAPYYNGYGFYPANYNPGVISTLPVTLTTGQTFNFPVGVFMSKVNNSQGNMYVTVPNNASLTSSGFECVANYGNPNTGLQCTFIDGTVLLFAVELWSQVASTGFAQVSCLNPGCVCDGFMSCQAS